MTTREVKDWLNRGYYVDKEIQNLKERRARLWQEINNVVPAYESDGTMFNPDIRSKEKKLAIYEELLEKLDERITELRRLDAETQLYINKITDSGLRLVVELRSIERMNWRDISKRMHVVERTAQRYFDDALEELVTILEFYQFEF